MLSQYPFSTFTFIHIISHSNSLISSLVSFMNSFIQNAHKLFVKITKRNPLNQCNAFHTSSWENLSNFQNPVGFSSENENVISWTSKISNLVRKNQTKEAVHLFKTMLMSDERPNYVTVLSVIKAIGEFGNEKVNRGIHGYVIKMGFEAEVSVVTALLSVYSGWVMEAVWKLFDNATNKDVVLWSAMVSTCVRSGEYVQAFELFREMQFCDVQPNHVSVVSLLPACADIGVLRYGKEVHGFSIKKGYYSHTNVQNSLVDMYAKCGDLMGSIRVFKGMQRQDLVSWRSMIHGCVENECPEMALSMFSEMRYGCFEPDKGIIREVIGASSQVEEINVGQGLHAFVLKWGYSALPSVVTALLQMYSKFGQFNSSRILFDQLCEKDLIAWSAMISAYAQSGRPDNSFDVFRQMQLSDEKPNEVTFVSLLQACSSMGAQEIGESIHAYVMKAGYVSNAFLTSALIDLYCKFGRVRQGMAIFRENPTSDFICWSSMINGFGINGCGDEALECFSNMLSLGINPNDVVFISVLSACSHCGLEYEGWNWFYAMEEKYGITPKVAHYACMVDMLSRQGNIEAALGFVNNMPIEPDQRIWGALLAGCRKANESFENTEFVAKQLIRLDPQNTSYYVFLSNLYAEQGRWKEVEKLRDMVDGKGLKKEMGYSMVYANNSVSL